jgi:hypothetical protein
MRDPPSILCRLWVACGLLCSATSAPAQVDDRLVHTRHETLSAAAIYQEVMQPATPTHALRLALAYFPEAGWSAAAIIDAARTAAAVLGQCAVVVSALELHRLEGDARYHYYSTPRSRELARRVPLPRPTIYFVADSLQRPAFDAEAIGRGNSKTRPELADTVWVTRGARDLGIALAHELAHVLMDSGEHVEEPGNLMRAETAPQNTRLDAEQCARLRDTAAAHGLLHALKKAD